MYTKYSLHSLGTRYIEYILYRESTRCMSKVNTRCMYVVSNMNIHKKRLSNRKNEVSTLRDILFLMISQIVMAAILDFSM